MFDDLFLITAAAGRVPRQQITVLSLRPEENFILPREQGWEVKSAGIMLAREMNLREAGVDTCNGRIEDLASPLLIGDLAAYAEDKRAYVGTGQPDVVKANFVSSTTDGGSFLMSSDPAVHENDMLQLIAIARTAGYTCFASTWYRDDIEPEISEIGAAPDMSLFPFNLIAVKDPEIGRSMKIFSEVHDHLAQGSRLDNAKLIQSLDRKIKERDQYIHMLEDAMISLQPSEKIKLKRS